MQKVYIAQLLLYCFDNSSVFVYLQTAHKLRPFKQAMDKHHSQMRYCMAGQGIDRHLLGLKVLSLENNLPLHELFTDPAFQKR